MSEIGSGLGTGGFIVFDDRTDPVELASAVSRFLYVESCGQCPACKLGCEHLTALLESPAGFRSISEWCPVGSRRSLTPSGRAEPETDANCPLASPTP